MQLHPNRLRWDVPGRGKVWREHHRRCQDERRKICVSPHTHTYKLRRARLLRRVPVRAQVQLGALESRLLIHVLCLDPALFKEGRGMLLQLS